jgi:putative iron-dependent peroxidase
MITGQIGIFALGDSAHGFFEFSLLPGADAQAFASAIEAVKEPRSTTGGVNRVIGFRPSLWERLAPDDVPANVNDFDREIHGPDDYVMPATQADAWIWFAAASYDIVFDLGQEAVTCAAPFATLVRETTGWSYRHNRDLTGFEDGTKNPSLMEAPDLATIADGSPGAGGTVLLYQQWQHRADAWRALPDETQERVIGRTKPDSVELAEDVMPFDAHVPRTTIEQDGDELKIFRRNVAYGTVADHGTVFVGFGADQYRLERMLQRMAGAEDGVRDALTSYTTPLTGAYYFVPSLQALRRFATPEED